MQLLILLSIISYNLENFEVISVIGHSLTAFDFTTIFIALLFLKKVFWDGVELKIAKNPLIALYLLLHLSVVLSGIVPLFSGDHRMILQFIKTFSHFHLTVLFATVVNFDEIQNDVWVKALKLWLILVLFINIFGIYQIIARAYNLPFAWLNLTSNAFKMRGFIQETEITQLSLKYANFYRATSIYSEPSALASVNVITLTLLAVPLLTKTKQFFKSKFFNLIQIILSLIALFLTFSLTGLLGVFMVFSALLVLEFRKVYRKYLFSLIFATILILSSDSIIKEYTDTSVLELFTNRVLTITGIEKDHSKGMSGESFYWRASNIQYSIEAGLKSPIIGNGLGLTYFATEGKVVFSDSAISAIICELGFFGAFIFTAMFGFYLYYGFKYYRIYKKNNSEITHTLYILLPFFAIILIELNYIVANQFINMSVWLFMSMCVSLINNKFIEEGNYYKLKLIKTPFKTTFANSTNAYLLHNSKSHASTDNIVKSD